MNSTAEESVSDFLRLIANLPASNQVTFGKISGRVMYFRALARQGHDLRKQSIEVENPHQGLSTLTTEEIDKIVEFQKRFETK